MCRAVRRWARLRGRSGGALVKGLSIVLVCWSTNAIAQSSGSTGSVKVSKVVVDGQNTRIKPNQTFRFQGPNGAFTINPATDPSPEVIADPSTTSEISITEAVPRRIPTADVTCRRSDTGETVGRDITKGVSLSPIGGVLIHCTFRNKRATGTVKISKHVIDG